MNPLSRAWQTLVGTRAPESGLGMTVDMDESPTMGPHGPPAGVILKTTKRSRETHPLIGADVKQVHSALLSAFDGRPQRLMDLYDDMRDRDGRLNSYCVTRTLTLQSKEWIVKPPPGLEEDDDAIADAEWATKKLRAIREFPQFIGNMGDGILRGFSVNEIEWCVDRDGDHVPKRMHWRHPNRFCFDESLELRFSEYGTGGQGVPLDHWGPDKFIVHMPTGGRASYPTRRGGLLSCVFPTLTKRYGVRWWLKAAERWGQTLPILQVGDKHQAADGLEMLNAMMANWAGVIWGQTKIDSVPGSGNVNPDVYELLRSMADTENAIALLGQNLTSEVTGGSFAAEQGHELVRMDLLGGDAMEIEATLRDQLLEALFRYNRPGRPVSVFKFRLTRKGKIEQWHAAVGAVSKDDIREGIGHDPVPDGEGAQLIQVAPAAPSFGGFGGASDPDPFGMAAATTGATTPARSISPTSAPSTSPPAHALYRALAGRAPSRSSAS